MGQCQQWLMGNIMILKAIENKSGNQPLHVTAQHNRSIIARKW